MLTRHCRVRRVRTLIACAALVLALTGCAGFSKDGGFARVADIAQERTGHEARWARTAEDRDAMDDATRKLIAQPLTIDTAVQVALLNNPGLQARYAALGVSEADLIAANRLPNPSFTFSRTRNDDNLSIGRMLSMSLFGALTLPFATRVEQGRFEQTQLEAANALLDIVADTRRDYVDAVAAEQSLTYAEQVRDAALAAAQLSQAMRAVGNISMLDEARAQAFHADADNVALTRRRQATTARERLTRVLGLRTGALYSLPDHLPEPPTTHVAIETLEQYALDHRLDVLASKRAVQSTADSLGLTRATRWISAVDVGWQNNFETDTGTQKGYEVTIEVPLFEWGTSKVVRAESIYMQSVERLSERAIDARSEVRESYVAYMSTLAITQRYRDAIVPGRKKIAAEVLLRYNGMLASAFELLDASREQVQAVDGYIDALKQFWIADATLAQAVGGRLPAATTNASPDAATSAAPAPMQDTAPSHKGH